MADTVEYSFSHTDLLKALIRQQGLRDGIWKLTVNFGFGATNVGETEQSLNPAAIVQIQSVGLRKAEKISNLSVDASTL